MKRRIVLAALASAALFPQGKGKGKGKGKGHDKTAPALIFTESDRGVITTWARRQSTANLPPGLAKRGGALPPGLEKQLRRNGRLPPGLDRGSWTPFPPELIVTLPPLPPEYDRGFIGGQAVIVFKNTQIVIDIFKIF
jgi:hypothetical protein